MADHAGDLGLAAGAHLAVQALDEVEAAGKQLPPPALVADAVVPELVAGEGRDGVGLVAHEAAHRVRVEADQEGDEEVVRVPERLERLLPDAVVRRRVHQDHAEQHGVARDSAGLRVVDLERRDGPDLRLLDIEETRPVSISSPEPARLPGCVLT